jgi:hypothetical protein
MTPADRDEPQPEDVVVGGPQHREMQPQQQQPQQHHQRHQHQQHQQPRQSNGSGGNGNGANYEEGRTPGGPAGSGEEPTRQ